MNLLKRYCFVLSGETLSVVQLLVLMLSLPGFLSFAQGTFTSSNLPIIVINTGGQTIIDEPKITASMGIIDNGPGNRNALTDPFNNYNGKIGIEIRGSSSQMFPKKQYGIELRDDAGQDVDAPLLGMPPEEDWVLFAPYNDKSLMRDVLAYKLGRQTGRYAPRTRYCELVLNGQYMGVYVLIEKIKRDKNRVDINRLNPDEISGNNLTGGYIIKIDKSSGNGGDGWQSSYLPMHRSGTQTISFLYDVPNSQEIVTQQKNYIKNFMDQFENTLFSSSFRDPLNGYAKYIDTESFIDYFIINEISKNVDAYRLSTFMYKHRDSDGGKLHMGPIWDFNLGFGNVNYCTNGDPEGFVTNFNAICPQDWWLVPFWWNRLMEDATYRSKLSLRWYELRSGPFKTSTIHQYIDSVYNVLNQESQQRNFQRWPVLGQYIWPNYFVGQTFQQEVDWLKNWITQRMNWMDSNIPAVITDVEKNPAALRLQLYPNPTTDKINLEYWSPAMEPVSVTVTNSIGQPVLNYYIKPDEGGLISRELDLTNCAPGMYFFTISSSSQLTYTRKIIRAK